MAASDVCVVVGTGSIGSRHLALLHSCPDLLALAFPLRPERQAALVAQGFKVISNWQEAIDLGAKYAIIATNTHRHAVDAIAALKAGCQVLVEKPLAVDVATAQQISAVTQTTHRRVWVACCLRFQEALNQFRNQLKKIGRVHSVRIECQSYLPDWRPARPYRDSYSARADEGGVLRDLIHEIDYAGWLFGWPVAVQGRLENAERLGIAAEETADLLWKTATNITISMHLDYLSRPPRRRMSAFGELGTLEWDGLVGEVTLARAKAPAEKITATQTHEAMYLAQDLAFLQAGHGQLDGRLATETDGLRALGVCEAARRASNNGQTIKVIYP